MSIPRILIQLWARRSGAGEGFLGLRSCISLMLALHMVAEEQDEQAPAKPCQHIPAEGGEHRRVLDTGIRAAAKDRGWMLRAPPAIGHIDDGHVECAKDPEDCRKCLHLWASCEAAQQQVADID